MLKILSWNINRSREPWQRLIDCDADIALLQEATEPPAEIASRYDVGSEPWETHGTGRKYGYRTAFIRLNPRVNVERIRTAPLTCAEPTELPVSRVGTIAGARVQHPDAQETFDLFSIYGSWESPRTGAGRWIYADATCHRLISDLSALIGTQSSHQMLAAGDLNILRGYGDNGSAYWTARYQTVFDRFDAVGMPCVGPQHPDGRRPADPWPAELPRDGLNVPTFRPQASPASAVRQLDFVFASKSIAARTRARAMNELTEWGPSDHCQIRIEVA